MRGLNSTTPLSMPPVPLFETCGVLTGLSPKPDDILPSIPKELLDHEMVLQNAVDKKFSRPIRGLERFANNSNIPWNQSTIFHPGQIAEVPRDVPSFTLRTALPAISFVFER